VYICICKVKKSKLSLCLRHEDNWGSGCIDPRFVDLGTNWRWVVSFTPRLLYPQRKSPCTHWIGVWVNLRAALDDIEKWKFLLPLVLKLQPLGHPAHSQLLYWLCYPLSLSLSLSLSVYIYIYIHIYIYILYSYAIICPYVYMGMWWHSWLSDYTTSWKVAALIPHEFTGFFNWPNLSSHNMALGSTQSLTEMSIRNLPGGNGQPAHKTVNLTAIC
jgi:hypothetical protein